MSGTKFDNEKVDLHVLDPLFVEGTARVSQFGEQKYGKSNWKKGLTQTRIINAIRRHLAQIEKGEDIDNESGFHHAYHIAWGCQVLAYQHRNGQFHLDDRRWSEDFRSDNFHNGSRAGIGGHTVPMLQDGPFGGLHPVDGSEVRLAVSDMQPKTNEGKAEDPITESQRMIAEWADVVYPDRTPEHAITKMMLHEIPELLQGGVDDPLEFADVAILLFDIAHLKGIDIGKAIADKMEINKKRVWGIDRNTGVMSHVKLPVEPTPALTETTEKVATESVPPAYPWEPRIPEWAIKADISCRVCARLVTSCKIVNPTRCILIHKNEKNRSHLEKFYYATIKDIETEEEYNVSWSEIEPWNA